MSTSWSADHIRISLFANEIWSAPVETVYSEVFGEVPESTTNKPFVNEFSAFGVWNGLRLEVKHTFNRIDFILQELPSETAPMPLIKDIQTVIPIFSSLVSTWAASQAQGVVRIALGCNAFLLSSDVKDSYTKLQNLVKVISVDVERFKEFRFQVNLPISSTVSNEIIINRLSSWASIALRVGLISAENPRFFDEKHYVACTLDVNTDSERTIPIAKNLIEKLSNELSSICVDTLHKGIS
jgi:hypothetical protein